jgi:hypothetical protein
MGKQEIRELIKTHDQVIMMGHGSPNGLFSMGKFNIDSSIRKGHWDDPVWSYIIDIWMVEELDKKDNNIFIWCNADQFVNRCKLKGFYTGMFVSEVTEASYCGLDKVNQSQVDESNNSFAVLLGDALLLDKDPSSIFLLIRKNYGELITENKVAEYNYQRLFLNESLVS